VQPDRRRQAGQEPLSQRTLPGEDVVPAERLDVLDRGDEAGEQLVGERPGLEALAGRLERRRPHLVRPPPLHQVVPCVGDPEVRPEELVRRADQHVDAERRDVDRAMRREVHGVGPCDRARLLREGCDPWHVGQRPDRVRRDRKGDDPRPVAELPFEVVEVERCVVVDVDEADDQVAVARQLEPGGDVGVVVEPGAEDLVPGFEVAAGCPREREAERGHVRAEDGFLGRAAEESAGGLARAVLERLGASARLVRAADVRVRGSEVVGDRLDHLVRHLRAARSVEVDEVPLERGKPGANGGDVEAHAA
jgi:hypothetical protein